MGLKTSTVYRCLDKKTLVFGFELVDLFLVFALLAFLNLVMGSIPYKFLFTWVPSLSLAVFIKLIKRGKPDNFLLHYLRFYFQPKVLTAFSLAKKRSKFIKPKKGIIYERKSSGSPSSLGI